ncbi:hypothetical protein [Paraburkholderia domus]|uniref:hypothetical protein n=1 Tax=Paraburkholderia domus TaxID=2793075 RepID=UPI001B8C7A3B|nr:hypothetical protein [Paraburkholderia domus]
MKVTRDEIVVSLMSLGEDPIASRVDAIHAQIDGRDLPNGERGDAVREAVDLARVQLDDATSVTVPAVTLPGFANDFDQAEKYNVPVKSALVLFLPVTDFRPEPMRVSRRESEGGTWFEVETYSERSEAWVSQKEHNTEPLAIADAKGWYPAPAEPKAAVVVISPDEEVKAAMAEVVRQASRDFARLTVSLNADSARSALIKLGEGGDLAAMEPLRKAIRQYAERARGVGKTEATRALKRFDSESLDSDAEIIALGVATITSVGSENVYLATGGRQYYFKPGNNCGYKVGKHDFSKEPSPYSGAAVEVSASPYAEPANKVEVAPKRLWLAMVEHETVPGTRIVLSFQSAEPADEEILSRFSDVATPEELEISGLFDVSHALTVDDKSLEAAVSFADAFGSVDPHIKSALQIGLRAAQECAFGREQQERSALASALRVSPEWLRDFKPSGILTGLQNDVAYVEAAVRLAEPRADRAQKPGEHFVWEGGSDVATCNDIESARKIARALRQSGSKDVWISDPAFQRVADEPEQESGQAHESLSLGL